MVNLVIGTASRRRSCEVGLIAYEPENRKVPNVRSSLDLGQSVTQSGILGFTAKITLSCQIVVSRASVFRPFHPQWALHNPTQLLLNWHTTCFAYPMRTSGCGINAKQMGLVRQRSTIAKAQARTIEQASSGKRINRAADDVARLAASTQMKVRADALAVANRNLNDVTSLPLQTAEGGMESAGNIIKRMTELATHASSAGLSEEQRGYLIHEFEALKVDLDHLAETVEYNGEKMLGEGICVSFQSGPDGSSDSRYHFELRPALLSPKLPYPTGRGTRDAARLCERAWRYHDLQPLGPTY